MSTISSDVIRGYNDTMILYILLNRPSYGYEISKLIRGMSEEKYIIKRNDAVFGIYPQWKKTVISNHFQTRTKETENDVPITE